MSLLNMYLYYVNSICYLSNILFESKIQEKYSYEPFTCIVESKYDILIVLSF